MKYLYNDKGIALVTSLMFTVLSLVITMTLLYMVTAGIRTSGAMKRYKTTTEAAYGGADIMLKDILSKSLRDGLVLNDNDFKTSMETYLQEGPNNTGLIASSISPCLRAKVLNPNSQWSAACANTSLDAKQSFDVKFNLRPESGTDFVIYSKIVDTSEYKIPVFKNMTLKYVSIAGNSDPGSLNLEGGAVVDSGSGGGGNGDTNPHRPYRYRVEVLAERAQNATEKSKLSISYVY